MRATLASVEILMLSLSKHKRISVPHPGVNATGMLRIA